MDVSSVEQMDITSSSEASAPLPIRQPAGINQMKQQAYPVVAKRPEHLRMNLWPPHFLNRKQRNQYGCSRQWKSKHGTLHVPSQAGVGACVWHCGMLQLSAWDDVVVSQLLLGHFRSVGLWLLMFWDIKGNKSEAIIYHVVSFELKPSQFCVL